LCSAQLAKEKVNEGQRRQFEKFTTHFSHPLKSQVTTVKAALRKDSYI